MLTPKRAGYMTITGPGKTIEADTVTCSHCNRVWAVRSNDPGVPADLGGWCRLCNKAVCSGCAGKECVVFEKKLDLYEKRQDLFVKMGLSL